MMTEHEAVPVVPLTEEEYKRLKRREYQREWERKNQGRIATYKKKWADKNPEKKKESAAKYRAKSKDKIRDDYDKNMEDYKRRAKECYERNRQTYIDRAKKQREEASPQKLMFTAAKARAKINRLPFDIDVEDIVIPEYCPVLGLKLERNSGGKSHRRNSPSLDKIVPELGYVKGNIQVLSVRANYMKSDASIEELLMFAKWVQDKWGTK